MTSSASASRQPLRIGIDARAATEVPGGRGRVVRELLRALAHRDEPYRYRCYARSPWTEQLDERFTWKLIPAHDPIWHFRTAAAANRECDALPDPPTRYLTVPLLRIPAVAVIHDMVAFERQMHPNRRSLLIERLTLGPAIRHARGLICVSQATREALLARYPVASGKTIVAHLGVSPRLSAPEAGSLSALPAPGFVLAVGTLEPRKNLPRLVAAYAALPCELQAAHPLVVVGPQGWQMGPTIAALHSLGERVFALGHVSDAALAELYHRCAVFCYPSLGEGFGLPVLEAMAAGAAVITSNISSLPEVGGDAVAYVDPHDPASISAELERLLASPASRVELGALARERATMFAWSGFAEQTLEALMRARSRP